MDTTVRGWDVPSQPAPHRPGSARTVPGCLRGCQPGVLIPIGVGAPEPWFGSGWRGDTATPAIAPKDRAVASRRVGLGVPHQRHCLELETNPCRADRVQSTAARSAAVRVASASSTLIGGPMGRRSCWPATRTNSSVGGNAGCSGTTRVAAGIPSARTKSRKLALSCTSRMRVALSATTRKVCGAPRHRHPVSGTNEAVVVATLAEASLSDQW